MLSEECFAAKRRDMVRTQLEDRRIVDPRVLEAFRSVPRHEFVPEATRQVAYEDHPIQIGLGQTISQPYMVAAMTELLLLHPGDRVLEVGTGSGYQAAILSALVTEVVTVERLGALADEARERLARLGYGNVTVVVADGTLGCPEHAPYDAIVVAAASPYLPPLLVEQLKEGGRLVCPVGGRMAQTLVRGFKRRGVLVEEFGMGCVFVPLIGAEGWSEGESSSE